MEQQEYWGVRWTSFPVKDGQAVYQSGSIKRWIFHDVFLIGHFENDFQFNRGPEREACNAVDETARVFLFSEHVLE